MKTLLFIIPILLLLIGPVANCQTTITGSTMLDQSLSVNSYMAKDTTITGTKYSDILVLNSKSITQEDRYVNYSAGAHILVLARQTNDSVNSIVYLQVGQNLSGTEGTDYGTIYIDTLLSTRKLINIDLTPYLDYKQVRLKVVAITGVGVSAHASFLPKWSAILGGKGYLGKITAPGKAPTLQ